MSLPSRSSLAKTLTIPTLPRVVARIGAMLDDPDSGLREIGTEIAFDAPLTAKVLRIVNGARYGLQERCHSTERACAILGSRVLRNIVFEAAVIRDFERLESTGFDIDHLWRHSALTAQVCALLSREMTVPSKLAPDEMYLCGLLHDIGQIVLLDNLQERYVAIISAAEKEGVPIAVAEMREVGISHTGVGTMVAGAWGFPARITCAIQLHHEPRDATLANPTVALVASSDPFVEHAVRGELDRARAVFEPATRKALGLSEAAVERALEFLLAQDRPSDSVPA